MVDYVHASCRHVFPRPPTPPYFGSEIEALGALDLLGDLVSSLSFGVQVNASL